MNLQGKNIIVSIIVPAYREERYIEKTLLDIKNILEKGKITFEIICVVDGKVDNTYEICQKVALKFPDLIKVIAYSKNKGKGFALRLGFSKAIGKYIGFIDADGQINENVILTGLEKFMDPDTDMVIGSKRHSGSNVKYSIFRKIVSYISQIYIKLFFNLGVSDTQAGFKIFKRKIIKELLPRLTVDRFAFDIEALAVSKYLGYANIIEVPIKVKMLPEDNNNINKLLLFKDIIKSLKESLSIFVKLRILKYYDSKNKANWKSNLETKLYENSNSF